MRIKPTVTVINKLVGLGETPIIAVAGIVADIEVGMEIIPTVNILRADGITPIADVKVDFFVSDTDGVSTIGDRQLTDVNGDATAAIGYYVSSAEENQTIGFIIVTRRKIV